MDFDTWFSSPPPELIAYLEARSFDIREVLSGRSSTSSASHSASVWTGPSESSIERQAVVLSPNESRSPARISAVSGPEISSFRPTEERSQQSTAVAAPSTVGASALAISSNLLLEPSASGSVSSAGVLPLITITSPSIFQPAPPPITATASSPAIVPSRPLLEARLATKQTGVQSRLPGTQVGFLNLLFRANFYDLHLFRHRHIADQDGHPARKTRATLSMARPDIEARSRMAELNMRQSRYVEAVFMHTLYLSFFKTQYLGSSRVTPNC